jgi:cis-L-3-hydroxyproline dehydratase
VKLSKYQKQMADGAHGVAKQRAMQRLIKFGEAVDAEEMVHVNSAHILGPDFIMGKIPKYDYGTGPIYREFAALNAKVTVLTTTDPCAMQTDRFSETGLPWNYRNAPLPVECRDGIIEGSRLLDTMGIINCSSCIPYLSLNIPKFNEYHACCESNASCYANSMCGAKTNRESSITSFYAAITGVLPKYGLLCEENRKGQMLFTLKDRVKQNLKFISDWNALGAFIGTTAYDRIPVIANLPKMISIEQAKALSATASPALHFPKMNMIGISPDSPSIEAAFGGKIPKGVEKIEVTPKHVSDIYESLNSAENDDVDIVVTGCPFLTFNEIREIARKLSGKKIHENVAFWLQTDIPTYLTARFFGFVDVIEKAGAKIYHDTCMGNGPADKWGKVNIATDSFKNIKLFAGRGQRFLFGGLDDLIAAGISGKFVSTRRID